MPLTVPLLSLEQNQRLCETRTGRLVLEVRLATRFLLETGYSVPELSRLTARSSETDCVSPASIRQIPELRLGYLVHRTAPPPPQPIGRPKRGANQPRSRRALYQWVEAPWAEPPPGAEGWCYNWVWRPTVEMLERLERLIAEANRLGYDTNRAVQESARCAVAA